ncbi:MAG: ATP-binding protein [Planctomycetes bacterium]|nr:ATP-binding protein [Planctomycetota bacterium]
MIERPIWIDRLHRAWKQRSIVWLSGVRRVGKTVLARSLTEAQYFNCDLPSVIERLRDPERLLTEVASDVVVFDEIHQAPNPSQVLKIAADAFPRLKVLATGSSTLAATSKFRDALTDRKRDIAMVPVLADELAAFGVRELTFRLLRGGLPPALLAKRVEPEFYAEWLDSYFARDVQELFHLRQRAAFLRVLELILRQSAGLLEYSSLSKHGGVTRATVANWVHVLEVTHVVHTLRPYARGGRRELLTQPKVYGFDTGFVCFARGWDELRAEDCGGLWEQLTLDTLLSIPVLKLHYWRDKQQREVDFVIPVGRDAVDAIECTWTADSFEPRGLAALRENYPRGRNFLVAPIVGSPYKKQFGKLTVTVAHLTQLRALLGKT